MPGLTDAQLDDLIVALQTTTPLTRVNVTEAKVIFAKLAELGYTLTKPAA